MDASADPGAMEDSQQGAGVAVSQIGLRARRRTQPFDQSIKQAHGTIPATGKPHRVDVRVVGGSDEGSLTGRVIAREMSMAGEALGIEANGKVRRVFAGQFEDQSCNRRVEGPRRRDHGDVKDPV